MSDWNLVRLELARTPEFPQGSASRAYLLRVPLDAAGVIDEAELRKRPAMGTVRRFWPKEADQSGYVIRRGESWAFSYAIGEEDDEKLCHLEAHPLLVGEYIALTEPDGTRVPFRVVGRQLDGVTGP